MIFSVKSAGSRAVSSSADALSVGTAAGISMLSVLSAVPQSIAVALLDSGALEAVSSMAVS